MPLSRFQPTMTTVLRRQLHSTPVPRAPSRLRGFLNLLGSALASDDRINPKRMLERRYLYFALTVLRYRALRLEYPDTDTQDLRLQAVEDLHGREKVDDKSNAELRMAMQKALTPQVLDIFQTFAAVDETIFPSTKQAPETTQDYFDSLDWPYLLDVLRQEAADTRLQLDKAKQLASHISNNNNNNSSRTNQSLPFLQIKIGALDTLLHYHQLRNDPPAPSNRLDFFGMDMDNVAPAKLPIIRQYQTINMCRSALIRQSALGYSVLSLRSTLDGAGRGTFIDGDGATTGSLVAFQPGDIWPKEHLLTDAPEVMEHFASDEGDEDCQTSLRFDEFVLDSRTAPVTILSREGSLNPWALGHMVNHPQAGELPNAQSLMLDFTEKMNLRELTRYIPNVYAREPGWQSRAFDPEPVVMHSMCLLARKDVQNEELFYDYRLQSDQTPEWYHTVSYGDEFLDNEQVVFFRDDWRKDKDERNSE